MRREVSNHILVGLLVLAVVLLALYFLGKGGPTGFAVFEQQAEADFSSGEFVNVVYDENMSAVVLDSNSNETTGTYTSEIIDAEAEAQWNNMTWQGEVPENTTLSFQVRSCMDMECVNETFSNAEVIDDNLINLSSLQDSRYFQYEVSFSGYEESSNESNETTLISPSLTNVIIDYMVNESEILSLEISEPSGEKSSGSQIPLEFTVTGIDITCWYNVIQTVDEAVVIENTTIADCASPSAFDLPEEDENYILTLYVNDSSGAVVYESSGFSVNIPEETTETTSETEETTEEEEEENPVLELPSTPPAPSIPELNATDIASITLDAGSSQTISWLISNIGSVDVSSCSVRPLGDFASWITPIGEPQGISAGEQAGFSFDVSAPETASGSYLLSVSVECAETAVAKDFNVDVIAAPAEETIVTETEAEGTPTAGFVIFGEGGIGTGGIILLVIVVLALAGALLITRTMRRSGKTLRQVFAGFRFRFRRSPQPQ